VEAKNAPEDKYTPSGALRSNSLKKRKLPPAYCLVSIKYHLYKHIIIRIPDIKAEFFGLSIAVQDINQLFGILRRL
jgi:hypothetical protein